MLRTTDMWEGKSITPNHFIGLISCKHFAVSVLDVPFIDVSPALAMRIPTVNNHDLTSFFFTLLGPDSVSLFRTFEVLKKFSIFFLSHRSGEDGWMFIVTFSGLFFTSCHLEKRWLPITSLPYEYHLLCFCVKLSFLKRIWSRIRNALRHNFANLFSNCDWNTVNITESTANVKQNQIWE